MARHPGRELGRLAKRISVSQQKVIYSIVCKKGGGDDTYKARFVFACCMRSLNPVETRVALLCASGENLTSTSLRRILLITNIDLTEERGTGSPPCSCPGCGVLSDGDRLLTVTVALPPSGCVGRTPGGSCILQTSPKFWGLENPSVLWCVNQPLSARKGLEGSEPVSLPVTSDGNRHSQGGEKGFFPHCRVCRCSGSVAPRA